MELLDIGRRRVGRSRLGQDPRRHCALPIDDGRLDRIQESSAKLGRQGAEQGGIHQVAIRSVREAASAAARRMRTNLILDPDARGEAREEEATRCDEAPRSAEHRQKVGLIRGKVQDGAADDDIRTRIGERRVR